MRLLQFVTGTCRLPLGGFAELMGECCLRALSQGLSQGVRGRGREQASRSWSLCRCEVCSITRVTT